MDSAFRSDWFDTAPDDRADGPSSDAPLDGTWDVLDGLALGGDQRREPERRSAENDLAWLSADRLAAARPAAHAGDARQAAMVDVPLAAPPHLPAEVAPVQAVAAPAVVEVAPVTTAAAVVASADAAPAVTPSGYDPATDPNLQHIVIAPAHASSASPKVQSQIDGLPVGEQTIDLIPQTTFGLGSLGTSALEDIASVLPGVSYDPSKPNVLHLQTPSIIGYKIATDLHFEVDVGLKLTYQIDLGELSTTAAITSSITGTDTYGEPAPNSGAAFSEKPNGRLDLYTNYILDTALTDIELTTVGTPATKHSYVNLVAQIGYDIGFAGLGVYDGNDLVQSIGDDALYTGDHSSAGGHPYTKTFNILDLDPNQAPDVTKLAPGLTGDYSFPKLPNLSVTTPGLAANGSNGNYDVASDTGTGPSFANLNFNPIDLLPVIGEINEGSDYFIQTPVLDVGVEWKLIDLTFGLHLALTQTLSTQLLGGTVHVDVKERDANGNYQNVFEPNADGNLGDKLTLLFDPGIHFYTEIDETYTLKVRVTTNIDLTPYLTVDIGLLHLEAVINPIFIDEKRLGFTLFHDHETLQIASINLIDNHHIDFTLAPITVTTHVDTFLPVEGTPGNDHLDLPPQQDGVEGFAGDDVIRGNAITNHIDGGDGNDTITGSGGQTHDQSNYIHGGQGWDTINGGVADDIIYVDSPGTGTGFEEADGGDGNDVIYSNTANGYVDGGKGEDTLWVPVSESTNYKLIHGGADTDRLVVDYSGFTHGVTQDFSQFQGYDKGTLVAGQNGDTGTYFDGIEQFSTKGSAYADIFTGTTDTEYFHGGGGDDTLVGLSGNDVLFGEDGADKLYGGDDPDLIYGGGGIDTIYGGGGGDTIDGDGDNDVIFGQDGADFLFGGDGNDRITDDPDDPSNDTLHGEAGDDILVAGGGYDEVYGGIGNDEIHAGKTGSKVYGELGQDHIFANRGSFLDGGAGSDTYDVGTNPITVQIFDSDPIETPGEIFGSRSIDRLVGTGLISDDTTPNDDYTIPFAGTLRFWVANSDYSLTFDNSLTGIAAAIFGTYGGQYYGIEAFSLTGTDAADSFIVETYNGASGDDVLNGGGGNDILDGGYGQNMLDGGAGDDTIVAGWQDTVEGGTGFDTLYWHAYRGGEVLAIGDGVSRIGEQVGQGPRFAINGIERLVMLDDISAGDDKISGGAYDDVIHGGKGDDQLNGFGGDDTITGGEDGDIISGGDGDDHIDATDMSGTGAEYGSGAAAPVLLHTDSVDGGAGDDTITASNTATLIDGGVGDDTITIVNGGNRGDFVSTIDGGEGNDTIHGSSQAELILGGYDAANAPDGALDRLTPDQIAQLQSDAPGLDDDVIYAGAGDDVVWAGHGNDYVDAGSGRDVVHGGTGRDQLLGGPGATLYGDDGDDLLTRRHNGDFDVTTTLDGGAGFDIAIFSYATTTKAINFTLGQTTRVTGRLILRDVEAVNARLSEVADHAIGGKYTDVFIGGGGADHIRGGGGDDIIYQRDVPVQGVTVAPDSGGDVLFGDDGNDLIAVEAAATVNGGIGTDTMLLVGQNDAINNAIFLSGKEGDLGPVHYSAVERLIYYADVGGAAVTLTGGSDDDVLYGSALADHLTGGGGNDSLSGGDGDDVLKVSAVTTKAYVDGGGGIDTAIVDLATSHANIQLSLAPTIGGPGTIGGSVDFYTPVQLTNVERLIATTGYGDDRITGGSLDDTIKSGGGNDIVSPGAGNDYVELGAGNDLLDDSNFGTGTNYFYGNSGNDTFYVGNNRTVIDGGDGNDTITVQEFFYGLPAYDTPDILDGGTGNDTITTSSYGVFHGGEGVDRLTTNLSKAGALNVDLTQGGGVTVRSDWTFDGFEQYFLTFGTGNDTVAVDYGTHRLDGGSGYDTLVIRAPVPEQYTVTYDYANVPIYTFANGMVVQGFEKVTFVYPAVTKDGTEQDDVLSGTYGDDILHGFGGNDTLNGGYGADTMIGGIGDDTYRVDNVADKVVEDAGGGTDAVLASVDYTLPDQVENGTVQSAFGHMLTGNGLANVMNGGTGNDTLNGLGANDTLYGAAGDDTLDGGAGADKMFGGDGNDHYVVDNSGDYIVEGRDLGNDTVTASITYQLSANVENLVLATGAGTIGGSGNADSNTITGNESANVLSGNAGDDHLIGGAGNDTLNGGVGHDTLEGGADKDTFKFTSAAEANGDTIVDYTKGETIDLSGIDANTLLAGNQTFKWIGTAEFSHNAGQLRLLNTHNIFHLMGDTNGDGIADFDITVTGGHPILADIVL